MKTPQIDDQLAGEHVLEHMPDGEYVAVPFFGDAKLPPVAYAIADRIFLARTTWEPARSLIRALRRHLASPKYSEGLGLAKVAGEMSRLNCVLIGEKGLFVGYDRPVPAGMWPNVGRRRGQTEPAYVRLAPSAERVLALLLLLARSSLHYAAGLGVTYVSDSVEIRDTFALGLQEPMYSHLVPRCLRPRCVTASAMARVQAMYQALRSCGGRSPRPVVSLDMLYQSLLEPDWRVRLVLLMVSLESLFGAGDGELSHRVSERAATFAYGGGPARLDAYRRLRGLYGLRSKFVHGAHARIAFDDWRHDDSLVFLEETVRVSLLRVLGEPGVASRFCTKGQGALDSYLDELVLAPG